MTEQAHASMPWSALVTGQLAAVLGRTGDASRAEALIGELKNGSAHFLPMGLATFYAVSGDMEEAANWAGRAIEHRSMTFVHHLAPFFRPTPWWPRLAKMMNLPC